MSAPASSTDRVPLPPPGPPPVDLRALALTQIPLRYSEPDVDLPDWAEEEDFAEGDLPPKNDLQGLLEQFKVSMAARKYSFTRKSQAQLECQETNVFPKLNDLDFKVIERVRRHHDQKRCEIAMELYKKTNGLNEVLAPVDIIPIQWTEILNQVIYGANVHSKNLNNLSVGLANDDGPDLARLSRIAITVIMELITQGDLCYEDSANLTALFDKPEYLKMEPYADPFNLDLFESNIHFY